MEAYAGATQDTGAPQRLLADETCRPGCCEYHWPVDVPACQCIHTLGNECALLQLHAGWCGRARQLLVVLTVPRGMCDPTGQPAQEQQLNRTTASDVKHHARSIASTVPTIQHAVGVVRKIAKTGPRDSQAAPALGKAGPVQGPPEAAGLSVGPALFTRCLHLPCCCL